MDFLPQIHVPRFFPILLFSWQAQACDSDPRTTFNFFFWRVWVPFICPFYIYIYTSLYLIIHVYILWLYMFIYFIIYHYTLDWLLVVHYYTLVVHYYTPTCVGTFYLSILHLYLYIIISWLICSRLGKGEEIKAKEKMTKKQEKSSLQRPLDIDCLLMGMWQRGSWKAKVKWNNNNNNCNKKNWNWCVDGLYTWVNTGLKWMCG